jgi:hypothetical protein
MRFLLLGRPYRNLTTVLANQPLPGAECDLARILDPPEQVLATSISSSGFVEKVSETSMPMSARRSFVAEAGRPGVTGA